MDSEAIRTVAVLGLGTMGHGIAQQFAMAGLQVRCFDQDEAARQSLVRRVRGNLLRMAKADVVDSAAVEKALDHLVVCGTEEDAVGGAQFVTEAIVEDLEIKRQLLARLESTVSRDAILASNSSSFVISETSATMEHPDRAILTHWFNPPHIVPVVEVVPGRQTSEQTTKTAYDLLERIGKTAVRIDREIPGFLVNRVQIAMYREVWDLLDRGIATAAEIDRAIRGSMGFRMAALGPLRINDFAGLAMTRRVSENLLPHMRSNTEVPALIRKMVDGGRHGINSGHGIFEYTAEDRERETEERDRLYLALLKLLHPRS